MKHLGTKTLETSRLVLRRFVLEDAQAMFDNWASDPDVTKYLTWPAHESVEVSRAVLTDWVSAYSRADVYQWAIELKSLGQPVGSIAAVEHNDRAELVHIGYCIGKNWWNQGIMSEALKAVMDFFFDEVGVNRVESRHDPNNPNSSRVMKKCGMKYEGTLRRSDWNNQGICDASWYGLLASERSGNMAYDKLVRDKIPEIIRSNGETPVIRVLDGEEYAGYLEKKLDEEVGEFHQARNVEELADIQEVVLALAEELGCSREALEAVYRKKHDQRGGFHKRLLLISKEG